MTASNTLSALLTARTDQLLACWEAGIAREGTGAQVMNRDEVVGIGAPWLTVLAKVKLTVLACQYSRTNASARPPQGGQPAGSQTGALTETTKPRNANPFGAGGDRDRCASAVTPLRR